MRTALQTGASITAVALLLAATPLSADKTTVTGVIGDAMCGLKHMMGDDEAACTRGCVKKGSDYALIVDDKLFTLKAPNESTRAELDKLVGQKATINGEQNGDSITVTSVRAAK